MKKLLLLLLVGMTIVSCKNNQKNESATEKSEEFVQTSEKESIEESAVNAAEVFDILSAQSTTNAALTGEIVKVCQHSGCWLDVKINDTTSLRVTFSDPDLTIPKDSKGKIAYIDGVLSKEIIAVETLKNYAKEDGLSQEEINRITEPGIEYSFEADKILLKDK